MSRRPRKVLFVFGTRPEAIKMAPLVLALRARPRDFVVRVAVTAQHRGLLDPVLRLFGVRPHHDLRVMRPGQSLTDVSVRALARLAPVMEKERPDLVLVHGDTTTTLMGALAAFYHRVPVGHVEAGLRSGDDANPFPEEANRRLADSLCALHFAPTPGAAANLRREGISPSKIFITGNTAIDALRRGLRILERRPPRLSAALRRAASRPFVLVTAHRRENFGVPLRNLCRVLARAARKRPGISFVFPVHPNPRVRSTVRRALGGRANVRLTPPLDYPTMLWLLERCRFVITDSGGLQEEAPDLGKPVLVFREKTERPEAVRAGAARLVGTGGAGLARWIDRLLDDAALCRRMARPRRVYGDGRASERTVSGLREFFERGRSSRRNR